MGAALHNPGVERRVILAYSDGAVRTTDHDPDSNDNWLRRRVDLQRLLVEGWQVVSVTPTRHDVRPYQTTYNHGC
jgi:hypothetical protein